MNIYMKQLIWSIFTQAADACLLDSRMTLSVHGKIAHLATISFLADRSSAHRAESNLNNGHLFEFVSVHVDDLHHHPTTVNVVEQFRAHLKALVFSSSVFAQIERKQ